MDFSKILSLLLIIGGHLDFALGRLSNFTGVSSMFGNKYMSNLTMWINEGAFNVDAIIAKPLDYGLRGQVGIQLRIENSQKYQTLFSHDFDLCKLLNEISRDTMINSWLRIALKYGNMMENCPVPADRYSIRNYRMDSNSIPVFLRPGDYRILALNYYGKRNTKSFDLVCRLKLDLKIY
ncbi:uncharacterized protein LOC142237688 [Haematobia irritans]|uniref:uncharacterized protein LOC142237688 n=1 Tax=Haematobia irritans TaxID=7368 RepID=UPI003F4FA2E0